jgi:hypothetical protein
VLLECPADGGLGSKCALSGGKRGACCSGRCTDPQADIANCGQCALRCSNGLVCSSGHCQAQSCTDRMAGVPCSIPGHGAGACCRNTCVDRTAWASDRANCGSCGHACAPGLACNQGVCVDPSTMAPPAWTCLEEAHACPAGTFCVMESCIPRACTADSEGLLCPNPKGAELGHCCGQVCTDLYEDHDNCRACGVRCAIGEACKNGECAAQ